MSNELVVHTLDGVSVGQRRADGFVNATELCRAAGKKWNDYWRLGSTAEFLAAMEGSAGIPADLLVSTKTDGPNELRGTWVHPNLAIHLAQWCSAKFAVQVSRWVRELLNTGSVRLADTGDVLLDSIAAIYEVRTRQLATEREVAAVRGEVADVRGLAERASATATAALHTAGNSHGYFTLLAYCKLTSREITEAESSRMGKQLTGICRERGIEVRRTVSERWGPINTYPLSTLQEFFQDDADPLNFT